MKANLDEIDAERQSRLWTWSQLAKSAGISPSTLTDLRRSGSCTPTTLEKLRKALGMSRERVTG